MSDPRPPRNPPPPNGATTDDEITAISPAPLVGGGRVMGGIGPGGLPPPARWPHALRALRHRDYRLLWSGALVSNIGSWMQNVAQAWLVYDLTASATWLGLDAIAGELPVMILLPIGGVLADRLNRRGLLVLVNLTSALLAVALALMAATGFLTPERVGFIILISVLGGVCDALRIPANQSMVPLIVGRDDLPNAIALNSIQFNASRAIGPVVAGVTLVHLGVSWSFALNALSFTAVIAALLFLHNPPPARSVEQSIWHSLREGVAYLRGRRDLLLMMALIVLGGLLAGPVTAKMLPVLASQVHGVGAAGYSQLVSGFGVGAVLGALAVAALSKTNASPWRAVPLYVGLGFCEVALAFGGPFPLAIMFVAAAGGCFVGAMVRLNAIILRLIPDAVLGRVSSFLVMGVRLGAPLGALIAGVVANAWGIRVVLWIYGSALIVIIPLLALGVRRRTANH